MLGPVPTGELTGKTLLCGWLDREQSAAFVLPSNITFAKVRASCSLFWRGERPDLR